MAKRRFFGAALAAMALLTASSITSRGGDEKIFMGVITDSQCAFNVHSMTHSHKEMTENKTTGSNAIECTQFCVKEMGGQYVLQTKDKIYKLSKPELGEKGAGRTVRVKGTLDVKTNTIQVRSIELVAAPGNK